MPYLGSYTGDYLGSYRGDPGLLGFLGRGIKKLAGAAIGASPLGGAARTVGSLLPARATPMQRTIIAPAPGLGGLGQRLIPGGRSGFVDQAGKPVRIRKDGKPYKKPRMNVGNARALRRSIRRQQGFVKLAKRALQGTGYRIATRGSSRPRTVSVRESGAGSVVVR